MKVTIGICAYNVEDYIEQCLRSAMAQSYSDVEIIVIDDGSTDQTGNIISRLAEEDQRIKFLRKKNEGHAAGREDIVGMMTGDAVYWLDSDDYLYENAVSRCVELMETNNADIVKTPIKQTDALYAGLYNRHDYLKILIPDKIRSNVIGSLFSKKMYKDVHHHIGFTFEDYYIYPRLADNLGLIVVDDQFTYGYRAVRPGSVTFNGRSKFRGFFPRAVHHADRYMRYKKEFPEETKVVLKRFVDYACMAVLFAKEEDRENKEQVIATISELKGDIYASKEVSVYKKLLVKEILKKSAVLPVFKILHTVKGNIRTRIDRMKGVG